MSLLLLLALLATLVLPEAWRLPTTLAAFLLIVLQPTSSIGRLLCHPLSLLVGMRPIALLPILALIEACSGLSHRLEGLFRYRKVTGAGLLRSWVVFPCMLLLTDAANLVPQVPRMGRIFAGQRDHAVGVSVNRKRMDGTTVDTVHCFQHRPPRCRPPTRWGPAGRKRPPIAPRSSSRATAIATCSFRWGGGAALRRSLQRVLHGP